MTTNSKKISIDMQQDGTTATISVIGWITTVTAPQVEDIMSQIPETTTTLVFDLTETEYISSYGIRLFVAAYKALSAKDGRLIIRHPNEFVVETLTTAGVLDIFEVEA